jgi:hypothetical protein
MGIFPRISIYMLANTLYIFIATLFAILPAGYLGERRIASIYLKINIPEKFFARSSAEKKGQSDLRMDKKVPRMVPFRRLFCA